MKYKFAEKPDWVKWEAPAREYMIAPAGPEAFRQALAGAVYDFTDPGSGESFQYFPVDRAKGKEVIL